MLAVLYPVPDDVIWCYSNSPLFPIVCGCFSTQSATECNLWSLLEHAYGIARYGIKQFMLMLPVDQHLMC